MRNFSRFVLVAALASFAAGSARADVTITPAVNDTIANCSAGSNTFGELFPPLSASGGTSASIANATASCDVAVSWSAGHIGIAYDANGLGAGAAGQLGYFIQITDGDILGIGFSVNGSATGEAFVGASILNANNPSGLFFTVSCTAAGCNKTPQASFTIGDGGYHIVVGLNGSLSEGSIGSVNFLNSLDATFTVPAGTVVHDQFGVIQVEAPEPAAGLVLALGALGLAARRRRD